MSVCNVCVFSLFTRSPLGKKNVGVWFVCCTVDKVILLFLNQKNKAHFEKHFSKLHIYYAHILLIFKISKSRNILKKIFKIQMYVLLAFSSCNTMGIFWQLYPRTEQSTASGLSTQTDHSGLRYSLSDASLPRTPQSPAPMFPL